MVDAACGNATVICPNPFYQIYEGAALLAGRKAVLRAERSVSKLQHQLGRYRDAVWAATQLVYVCSPGNPTGAVMPMADWEKLFELSRRRIRDRQ